MLTFNPNPQIENIKMSQPLKEPLNKSNNFELAKTADIFTENRSNRVTITAHFDENSDSFYCAQILLT